MENKSAGLSRQEAERLLRIHGENKLKSEKKVNALGIFAGQFKDLMIMILLASTVISLLMGEITEAVAIIAIVLLNAILGFAQELRTEKTLEALKNMAAPTANVLRDGKAGQVSASEVVPGDVILLKAGDKIPADSELIECFSLQCDEALLSGESLPVEKTEGSPIFMGTSATKGRGRALVTATGMSTEMGKIAGMLHEIEDEPTPLQKRLAQLGKFIAVGCLAICAIVSVTGILRGEDILNMFLTGISLAVAAVPEGLPAIVTIALALAVNRILKRRALVRRLHSVETMGCANVICSDKTGTLTENKMTVRQVFTMDYLLDVSGGGHEQTGEFTSGGRRAAVAASPTLKRLFEIAVECNNAQITAPQDAKPERDRTSASGAFRWEANGEPTEIALLVMAAKASFLQQNSDYRKLDEIPFDSERKRMTVLVRDKAGNELAFCKGAPDMLVDKCKYVISDSNIQIMTPAHRRKIIRANADMAEKAMRVLGFAFRERPGDRADAEEELVFVGLAGMIDPPRKEAYDAVQKCRQAGIRPVMITGDHKITAIAIAKELGIMRPGDSVLTGADIDTLHEAEFDRIAASTSVFARVNPGHKLKIVRALKKRGSVVAMTGDGVNDAPAVKEADIGVSMGITGTDVTKQAAAIILLDDNFATLVAAIEEGRVVYGNIRKFIRYLLSCNIGEVLTMFVGMLMGLPVVLLPIQILLVNLVTDGLPAMALGLDPAEPGVMSEKPRRANESVFSEGLWERIIFRGCLIGLASLAVFTALIRQTADVDTARTGALVTLVLSQLFHVFECKSEKRSLFQIDPLNNPALILAVLASVTVLALTLYTPWLRGIFSTVALSGPQLMQAAAFAAAAPVLSSLWSLIPKKRKKDAGDDAHIVPQTSIQ